MKKILRLFLLVLAITVTLYGCTKTPVVEEPTEIEIISLQDSINLKDTEVKDFDFTTLFKITGDGEEIKVLKSYLTIPNMDEPGVYTITCVYGDKFAVTAVSVAATIYTVELSKEEITINQTLTQTYNFKALFTAKIDGEIVEITDEMVTTNLKKEIGVYTYTVTVGNVAKTLTINVTNDHEIEIVKSYELLNIEIAQKDEFDYTTLFTIYVDGKITQTKPEMLDLSTINDAIVGNIYEIAITCQEDESSATSTANVQFIENPEIVVNSKSIVTYPNGENIDLTTLFEIKKGSEIIPVTIDMISGTIDYSNVGINTITLTYNNKTYTATVEVKRGVVINYAKTDHIFIEQGTDQANYIFAEDFIVIINGIRFNAISEDYLDLSTVDFNNEGSYEVKLSIPYNDKSLSLSGPKFVYYESVITYEVRAINYEIKLTTDEVKLPIGTTSYNPLNNIKVIINGINQTLTTNPDWASDLACYVKIISEDIIFDYIGAQNVIVEIYPFGPNKAPVETTFTVQVEAQIEIEPQNKVIFEGDTLYTKDLFKVSSDLDIEIDQSMISGKVDVFKSGVYEVSINYLGVVATAKVVVLNQLLKGTYITNMKTIATEGEEDEEGNITMIPGTRIGDMVFDDLDNITVDKNHAEVISAIDENTLYIQIGRNYYTLYYLDGIVVLDPNNEIKMSFSDYRRPLVYFSSEKYELLSKIDINYGKNHVLENTLTTYSIDTFQYQNKETKEIKWFGLKINLVERNNPDTVYQVSFGEVIYPSNFVPEAEVTATVLFNNTEYKVTMIDRRTAKVNSSESEIKKYANMTFTGMINNQPATIKVDNYGGYEIYIGEELYQKYGSYDVNNLIYGGVSGNEVYVYTYQESMQSIKFTVDLETMTFTYIEKDPYFGLYKTGNGSRYIFVDGYGNGIINFNTKAYYTTHFTYQVDNEIMTITYLDTKPSFEYGSFMTFYISKFLNVLTVKESHQDKLQGEVFENNYITTGAIINIKDYTIGAASDAVARPKFLSNIEIITKDGNLTDEQKLQVLNLKKLSFSKPGFYEFTITINVNGTDLTAYYALQVIDAIYEGNPLVQTYGTGAIYQENSLMIDKYGRGILNTPAGTFTGNVIIKDNSFSMIGYSENNLSVSVSGNLLVTGIMEVSVHGSANFNDYFTTGTHRVTGTGDFILHEFVVDNISTYILAKSTSGMGNLVELEFVSGNSVNDVNAIIKVTAQEKITYLQIKNWNSIKEGVIFADAYRGTYTNADTVELIVDGFGNAKYGTLSGTYTLNGKNLTFVSTEITKVFVLNKENKTYEIYDIVLDNSLVEGKTFTGEHQFSCGNYIYTASTSFSFEVGGKVIITSTSSSHDEGEDSCGEDLYQPGFASKTGVEGTYTVSGNKLIVNVGDYQFEFIISDLINVSMIKCSETNVSSDAHGYFKIGTSFIIQ